MKKLSAICPAALALLWGCQPSGPPAPGQAAGPAPADEAQGASLRVEPLAVQQARAYPETATGIFTSLADFEDVPGGDRGYMQAGHFTIRPKASGGLTKFVVNVTRTGVGALEAVLPAGSELVFSIPHVHDFTGYRLLSMALYSRGLRDDLRVRLVTDDASWRSHRELVRPGWNTVLIDIQRLAEAKGFDPTSVQSIRIGFADAAGAVRFNLDDILLIDNTRTIRPTPPGVVLRKSGLDYSLTLPGWSGKLDLSQGADGLWRWRGLRAEVRLAGPQGKLAASGEHLELMGGRRVGQVELLEHNGVRLRLANTWYFPTRAGQWASLAVRRIRWEHTFYGDGRWLVDGLLNHAGGRDLSSVGIFLSRPASGSGGGLSDHHLLRDFAGTIGRWHYLVPPGGPRGKTVAENYLRPGRLGRLIAAGGHFGSGDSGRDGFDESQGCFVLGARAGHCRFTFHPPPEGSWAPAFLISGRWAGTPHVTSEGMAIRRVVQRADGSILFALPGCVRRPTAVEVTGRAALLAGE